MIVKLADIDIQSCADYENAINSMRPELTVAITLKRYNGERYIDIYGEIKPEELR